MAAASEEAAVVAGDGAVEPVGVGRPVGALVAVPGPQLLGVGRVDAHGVGGGHHRAPYSPFGRVTFSQRENNVKRARR